MGVRLRYVLALVGLAACNKGEEGTCGAFDEVFVYADADGDGFGTDPIGWTCAPKATEATGGNDCDDEDATAFPGAEEGCDLVDNDCDGRVDEESVQYAWFVDGDSDGYGAGEASDLACMPPTSQHVSTAGDCDDALAEVNPTAIEVCNGGIDDDCDGLADDQDGGVDPSTATVWHRDTDADGFGADDPSYTACEAPAAGWVDVGGDCDETDPDVNPGAVERCNDVDDDCDELVDDADDYVDPAGQVEFFTDADLDGYGDPNSLTMACEPSPGAVANDDDCDDTDPLATVVQDWVVDVDLDGVGTGASIATACYPPGPGTAPLAAGVDCDDGDPGRFPGNLEVCGDGIDQDCNTIDQACATWLYTVRESDGMVRRIDVDTNTWESIGLLGTAFDFGDLAYDPETQTMWMVDGRGVEGLHTVDLTSGLATLVGIHGVTDLFGLTWDSSTGTLYASTYVPNGFYEMDVVTGAATYIGNPGVNLDGLAYDEGRDQLVGLSAGAGDLFRIDRATGARTLLYNGAFVNNGGLGYDPNNDMYWAIDWSGYLYRFDPAAGYARSTYASGLNSHDALVYVANPPN